MFGRSRQLLLATSLLTLALASPASAYLRDFTLRKSAGTTFYPARTQATPCPAGSTPLGGGGHITPESSGLAINRMWFDFQTRPFNTGVIKVDPSPDGTWRVEGQAFCTTFTTTGPGPAGGPYLRDVQLVKTNTATNSASEKIRGVSCFDKKVIASGWRVAWLTADLVAADSVRSVGTGGVLSVHAYEVDPTPKDWALYAFALCARVTPVANTPSGYVGNDIRVITSEAKATHDYLGHHAPCPPGMQVIGGGAQVLNAQGEVALDGSWPYVDPNGATGWNSSAVEDDEGPRIGGWGLRVRAICANIT